MQARAAITVVVLLLIASSQGCGSDGSRDGPPFEPGDIDSPQSLLITDGDIEEAGPMSPYGTVLRWWQALQRGDVKEVKRSYAKPISTREARRQIEGFKPRSSQPIDPDVKTEDLPARVKVHVRTATPYAPTPGVVSVRDFPVRFYLVPTFAGWKLGTESYEHIVKNRFRSRLAVR
jgi:hypothetical protein